MNYFTSQLSTNFYQSQTRSKQIVGHYIFNVICIFCQLYQNKNISTWNLNDWCKKFVMTRLKIRKAITFVFKNVNKQVYLTIKLLYTVKNIITVAAYWFDVNDNKINVTQLNYRTARDRNRLSLHLFIGTKIVCQLLLNSKFLTVV